MPNKTNSQSITASPRCYKQNPKARNFLSYDPEKPDVVFCGVHGEISKSEASKGPKFYFSHFESP